VSEIFAFLFGLVFGSFLNVCIRRLPHHESLVKPGSRCLACGTPIHPFDNIPVLSYLLLRGRCRACRARISVVYPLVELLTGFLFLACYLQYGLTAEGAKWTLFCSILLVLTFTDLHERLLPNRVNYFGLAAGLVLSLVTAPVDGSAQWILNGWFALDVPPWLVRLSDAALGAAFAGGLLWIFAEGYFRLRGREGMGLGDVKMMAMAGAFLGLRRAVLMMLAASILGSVVGAIIVWGLRKGSDYELPFGTFLAIAGIAIVFAGAPFLHWYLSISGLSP
jgi:leader peptidase (prepilin peptidase)/N-methyltransferase